MTEWINCKERLPTPGKRVLVYKKYRNFEKEIEGLIEIDFYMGAGNSHTWSKNGFRDVYWAELPKPPLDEKPE